MSAENRDSLIKVFVKGEWIPQNIALKGGEEAIQKALEHGVELVLNSQIEVRGEFDAVAKVMPLITAHRWGILEALKIDDHENTL